jgi:hypothetical protein
MSSTVIITDGTTTVTFTPGMDFDFATVKELDVKAIPGGRVINRDLNKRVKTWTCSGRLGTSEVDKLHAMSDSKHTEKTLRFTHPGRALFSAIELTKTTTSATSTTLTTVAGWTPNEHVGKLVVMTSGPAEVQQRVVISNTATTLTVGESFNPAPTPGGGDTFNILEGFECRIAEVSDGQPSGEGTQVSYICRMVER